MLSHNRRDFLRTSTLAGIGLGVLGPAAVGHNTSLPSTALSAAGLGGLALTAAVDDALRLAGARPGSSDILRAGVRRDLDNETPGNVALTAGGLRTAPGAVAGLLTRYREGRLHDDPVDADLRLGFALGWFAYRAARKAFASLYTGLSDSEHSERGLYVDAAVLRGRSGRASGEATAIDPAEVCELLALMGARSLVRYHTLNPDYDDIAGWIGRHAAWRERYSDYVGDLALAYGSPDVAKLRDHVVETNFYAAADPLIAAARGVESGTARELTDIYSAQPTSVYGEAVRAALGNLDAADRLLSGKLEPAGFVEVVR